MHFCDISQSFVSATKYENTSINAMENFWNDLKNEGFSLLLTRRLNQDRLKNFFSVLTPQHFTINLKNIYF
jgi:hypothetical protein